MNRYWLTLLFFVLFLITGCASSPPQGQARYTLTDFEPPGIPQPLKVADPVEPANKELYRFNYYFDRHLFLPVADGYAYVMPDYAENRVSNFFDNLAEFGNFTNAIFQLKPKSAGITLSRFLINTTLGIGGLWAPASNWDLLRQDEDFGQTLGHYGAGNGPYVVLPVLGPSNLRDTGGLIADTAISSTADPMNFDHNEDLAIPYQAGRAIDTRHRQPFRYYKSGSPFEYELVRLLYTEKRKLQVAK